LSRKLLLKLEGNIQPAIDALSNLGHLGCKIEKIQIWRPGFIVKQHHHLYLTRTGDDLEAGESVKIREIHQAEYTSMFGDVFDIVPVWYSDAEIVRRD
jgi:hypothetical protein